MKYISIIIAIAMLTGCSALGLAPPPSVCDTAPEDSVICRVCNEMGTTVEVADLILQSAALRALDDNDRATVLKFYEDVESILNSQISYAYLINYVQNYVELTGPEILLISLYLPKFESPAIISDYDKGLLLYHIDTMKNTLLN